MLARVITADMPPERIDSAVEAARDQLSETERHPGLRRYLLLADRRRGRIITISMWDRMTDLEAVEKRARSMRREAALTAGFTEPPVEIYEVALEA